MTQYKKLYRITEDKILGGVCTGLGSYFNVDPILLRLVWLLLACCWGAGVIAYLIAWIIIPVKKSSDPEFVHYDEPKGNQ